MEPSTKKTWKNIYTALLIANAIYLIIFFWITNSYK